MKLLNEQLEETISHLNSDISKTHGIVSALARGAEQLRSEIDKKDAEVHRLTEECIELKGYITSMTDREKVIACSIFDCKLLLIC